ncbi:MAG: hypothetical protein FJZ95_00965 [Chloroflexi bacterium]|nr:hypothetical protein [Chloroflexota bacterium]
MCLKRKPYKVEGYYGRAGYLTYREGEKTMRIDAERIANGKEVIFDFDIRWEPPHHEEAISEEKRQEIIANLKRERRSLEIWDRNRRRIG